MPKPGQTRADAGKAETRTQERVVPNLRPIVAKGEGRRSELIFKVGDRVAHSFKRYDGSFHEDVGTITRLWGKVVFVDVSCVSGGGIRASLEDLVLLRRSD